MRSISLFSGAGISDYGMHQAGVETLAQVEIYNAATSVRKRWFSGVGHYNDVRSFDALRFRGACDIVTAGFPCQDYSVAGNRAGISGDRGALFWEMCRVISEARPRILLLENVPGLLYSRESFRSILGSLVELGYSIAWRVLDLQYFGVPQRRRRVLIIGTRLAGGPGGRAGVSLFEPESMCGDSPQGKEAGQGYRAVSGTLSANGGGLSRPAGNANELDFCLPVVVDMAQYTSLANRSTPSSKTCSTIAAQSNLIVAGTLSSSGIDGGMAQEVDFLVTDSQLRVRRLLPVEAERLMGLPDGYTEFGSEGQTISNTQRYKMLGNGWSVPQAKWLAEKVMGDGKNG